MPTYEYLCQACAHQWEAVQKMSEDALTSCPSCKKETAKRQISGGQFILKGGGWASDLYSSRSNKKTDTSTETASKSEAPAPKKDS